MGVRDSTVCPSGWDADLETDDPSEGLPVTGHDDHAHIGMLAQVAREGEPVLARQAEIG